VLCHVAATVVAAAAGVVVVAAPTLGYDFALAEPEPN